MGWDDDRPITALEAAVALLVLIAVGLFVGTIVYAAVRLLMLVVA